MTAVNVLGQRQYAVNIIIADVGWLTAVEMDAIADAVGGSGSRFDKETQQLHLYWDLLADTMGDAIDDARTTLFQAQHASGVHMPRTCGFDIREMTATGQRTIAQHQA